MLLHIDIIITLNDCPASLLFFLIVLLTSYYYFYLQNKKNIQQRETKIWRARESAHMRNLMSVIEVPYARLGCSSIYNIMMCIYAHISLFGRREKKGRAKTFSSSPCEDTGCMFTITKKENNNNPFIIFPASITLISTMERSRPMLHCEHIQIINK